MAGKLKIFTDGASRGNPGEAGIGVIIYDQNDQIILEYGEYIGQTTNNIAEYKALIKALEEASITFGAEEIEVFADSELMVKQINGQYQVKSEGLIPLFQEAKGLTKRFTKFKLSHVLRGANKKADQLANEGTDCKGVVRRSGAKDAETLSKKSSSPVPLANGDYPEVEVKPGIIRKTLAIGPSLMVVEFKFKKGAEIPRHQHIHEQISYVVKGKMKFLIGEQEFIVSSGESIAIAGQVEHSVVALKDTLDIDVFSPIREDFL